MGMDMLGFEVLAYLGMAKNNNGEICVDCHKERRDGFEQEWSRN
jgi:hypothetical protein